MQPEKCPIYIGLHDLLAGGVEALNYRFRAYCGEYPV